MAGSMYIGGTNVGAIYKYLCQFVLRASNDAVRTFTVDLRLADTSLRNSDSQPLTWTSAGVIHVTVTGP